MHPFQKTLEALAVTTNPHAVDVLIATLRLPDEHARLSGLSALLRRRSPRANIEIIRELTSFSLEMRAVLEKNAPLLHHAVRQCLLHGEPDLRTNALELLRWLNDPTQIPTLLTMLAERDNPLQAHVLEVLRELVNRLYEQTQFGAEPPAGQPAGSAAHPGFLRDAPRIRHQVLSQLEEACRHFEVHRAREVVEGVLILGEADHPIVKRVLSESSAECRQVAEQLLLDSNHPGIMSLIADSLKYNYAHPLTQTALARRTDPEFLFHILRTWPRKLTPFQQKNLRKINHLAWLEAAPLELDFLPDQLHRALVAFTLATGIPQEHKLKLLEWVVRHGSPAGRLAATEVLAVLEDNKVQEVIIDGLESVEPDIQAWAVSQLRTRAIPHAFELLVQRLDSPIAEVRDAARAELGDFNLQRLLDMFDHMEPATCLAAGKLVCKIDPASLDKLRHELSHTIRRRRIRAARAALALNLHEQVLDALLLMVKDTDALVRRTGVEVLGHVSAPGVLEALNEALTDPSPRVREAAARSMQQVRQMPVNRPAAVVGADTPGEGLR